MKTNPAIWRIEIDGTTLICPHCDVGGKLRQAFDEFPSNEWRAHPCPTHSRPGVEIPGNNKRRRGYQRNFFRRLKPTQPAKIGQLEFSL